MNFEVEQQSPCINLVWRRGLDSSGSAQETVRAMAEDSGGLYGTEALVGGDDELAWSLRTPTRFSPLMGWSVFANGPEVCIVEGDFYDDPPGDAQDSGEVAGLAEEVARQVRANPDRRVEGLIGTWSGIYVDFERGTTYVFGDLTGTRPIFWCGDQGDFVVSNSLWAFRSCDRLKREWDPMALNQRLTIGIPLAGRTWFKDVKILLRGQQVRAKADGSQRIVDQNPTFERRPVSHREAVRSLREGMDAMTSSIARRSGEGLGIALSGGLDSRVMLASTMTQNIQHRAYTYCVTGNDNDLKVANRLGSLAGIQPQQILLDQKIAKTLIPDCLLANQGESRAYAHLMMGLAASEQGTNTLLVGYPGDVFAGHPIGNFDFHHVGSVDELSDRMFATYHTWMQADELSTILDPSLRVSWDDLKAEWRQTFDAPHQSIQDLYMDHVLDYRLQRRTLPRLDQSRPHCIPVLAFIDERVYAAYRRLPINEIVEERAHIGLLCDYGTGLENLPSTGKAFLGLPLKHEYNARKLIAFLRSLRGAYRGIRKALGKGGSRPTTTLTQGQVEVFESISKHGMYDEKGAMDICQLARDGKFSIHEVLQQLRCMTYIHDFMFDGGFPADCQPAMISTTTSLNWKTWQASQQAGT